MIRFLQKDSKAIKIVFWVIILAACVSMVVFLVPGIFSDQSGTPTSTYASIRPAGLLGKYFAFGGSRDITNQEVTQVAGRLAEQHHYPEQDIPFLMPQAAQALIQREILVQQADKLGLKATADDIRH